MTATDDIILDAGHSTRYPVLVRSKIGEKFIGGIAKIEQRDLEKKNAKTGVWEKVYKDNGKPAQQLVLHLVAKETDMVASQNKEHVEIEPGSVVRFMIERGGWNPWITAKDEYGGHIKVGLMFATLTSHAERYDSTDDFKSLGIISTQDDVEAWLHSDANLKRKEAMGYRGTIALKEGDDPTFRALCIDTYHVLKAQPDVVFQDHTGPFDGPAPRPGSAPASASDLW